MERPDLGLCAVQQIRLPNHAALVLSNKGRHWYKVMCFGKERRPEFDQSVQAKSWLRGWLRGCSWHVHSQLCLFSCTRRVFVML